MLGSYAGEQGVVEAEAVGVILEQVVEAVWRLKCAEYPAFRHDIDGMSELTAFNADHDLCSGTLLCELGCGKSRWIDDGEALAREKIFNFRLVLQAAADSAGAAAENHSLAWSDGRPREDPVAQGEIALLLEAVLAVVPDEREAVNVARLREGGSIWKSWR